MTQANSRPPTSSLGDWQHLHPLSPIVRGGLVGLGIVGYAASQLVDDVFRSAGEGDSGDDGPGVSDGLGYLFDHSLVAAAVIVGLLALVGFFGWLSWRFAKFRVADGQIEYRKGWLFREHRQVPLARVQAIEISRPLLAQLTGLSQVVVQSAGGGDSHLKLAFLGAGRADEVRHELLDLAGRSDETRLDAEDRPASDDPDGSQPATPAASRDEGREVLRVPNSRLFVATILHGGTIFLGAMAFVAGGAAIAAYGTSFSALTGAVVALPALGPIAFGVAVNRVQELLKHGNFRLSETGRSVRVQHGLTDKRTTSVPLHRIQAVEMVQPLWWRRFGWWRVRVNVAGVGSEGATGEADETTMLPVGTFDQALRVLTLLDPALSEDDLRQAALGDGTSGGWTLVSERARVFDWLSWRRAGFAVTPHSLLVRTGRLSRRVASMPHARVQSLTLEQGPWERRRRLAGVTLVSTPGPVTVAARHLDVDVATALLHDEAARAREARRLTRARSSGGDVLVSDGDRIPRTGCTAYDKAGQLVAPEHPAAEPAKPADGIPHDSVARRDDERTHQ